jgi:CHAT domain-containing protein
VILLNASLYATGAGLQRAARVFQDASLRLAMERGAENSIVEGHIRRARLSLAVRDLAAARDDVAIATRRMDAVRSAASRDYLRAWLDSVRGELLLAEGNKGAPQLFDDAISAFARVEPAEVPRLYLLRGRSVLPDTPSDAERAFRAGIDVLQQRMLMLNDRTHRVSYLDEGWRLFDELITLRVEAGRDANGAFALAERARVRAAADANTSGIPPIESPQQLMSAVPPDGALLYYVSLESRLLAWIVRSTGTSLVSLPIGAEDLTRRVTAYRRLLEAGSTGLPARRAAEDLYRILLQPVSSRLAGAARIVVVPDGALHAVPFAGLVDPATSQFLGDRFAVSTVPSATVLLALARDGGAKASTGAHHALVVGVGDAAPERNLPALPLVRREISDLEAVYPGATVLTGSTVDALQWRAAVANHDVVHFAGHAVVNTQYPDRSELILGRGPDGTKIVVTAGEIATWPLGGVRLVTLSACQTAYGAIYRGEGLSSLARQFVSAGVTSVVGTLWNVGDDVAHRVSVRFHGDYARSGRPVAALQESQRALVRSGLDPIVAWNAFIVIAAFD